MSRCPAAWTIAVRRRWTSNRSTAATWAGCGCWISCGRSSASGPRSASSPAAPKHRPGRKLDVALLERILFALVVGRALAPSSKLEATRWIREEVHIAGLAEVDHTSCYRAMDWLLDHLETLQQTVFFAVADLLQLDVDLIFFDTTSTYFETAFEDGELDGTDAGLAQAGPFEGLEARPAPGHDRDGGHHRRAPRQAVGVARRHPGPDRPEGSERRPGGVAAESHRVGGGRRVHEQTARC
jgi:hypothetical protein